MSKGTVFTSPIGRQCARVVCLRRTCLVGRKGKPTRTTVSSVGSERAIVGNRPCSPVLADPVFHFCTVRGETGPGFKPDASVDVRVAK